MQFKSDHSAVSSRPVTPPSLNLKTFRLVDVSNHQMYGSIACGTLPMIGSKIFIKDTEKSYGFRVRDIEYTTYIGSNDFDADIVVSVENIT